MPVLRDSTGASTENYICPECGMWATKDHACYQNRSVPHYSPVFPNFTDRRSAEALERIATALEKLAGIAYGDCTAEDFEHVLSDAELGGV